MVLLQLGASCQEAAQDVADEVDKEIARAVPAFALPTRGYLVACWDDPDPRVKSEFGDHHTGIDVWTTQTGGFLPSGDGAPVYSAYSGVVVESRDAKIEIANDSLPDVYSDVVPQLQVHTYYTHLSKRLIEKGSPVKKGDLIGYQGIGNGIVHLHFSVKKSDADERYIANTLDPSTYLKTDLASPSCGLGTSRAFEPFNQ